MAPIRRLALLPLTLNVKREVWRADDPNFKDSDSEFERVRKKALERDDYSCRFCTFRSPKYQEVHHFNDDHSNNSLDNLVTACPYCHMCQHIGLWGSKGDAVLIWLPEITQVELNHMVRTIQVAKAWSMQKHGEAASAVATSAAMESARGAQKIADAAEAIFASYKARQEEAEKHFLTSDPADLANVLLHTPDEVFARKDSWFAGLRLLPLGTRRQNNEDVAQKWVEVWMGPGGAYANLKPKDWVGLYRSALRQ